MSLGLVGDPMTLGQCWWPNFRLTAEFRQLWHDLRFRDPLKNKSVQVLDQNGQVSYEHPKCHQYFLSPKFCAICHLHQYCLDRRDIRFDFFLSYRAMFRCCMNTYQLQLQYRLGILLRSGLEMYNMILHIHTCLDMLYLDHVHHMRPFIELYLSVNRSNWPVSVNRLE